MKHLGYAWLTVATVVFVAGLIRDIRSLWRACRRRREINRSVSDFRDELRALGDITGEPI